MRVYIQTDLEGVAGVRNFAEWTGPDTRYYDVARGLLTQEINAAIDGLYEGGASYVMVADSHGPGAVDILQLDPRTELMRWDWRQPWPHRLQEGFDYLIFVGQHAKSRTPLSNMTHTGNTGVLERSVNGVAIGEFGQLALCASELGIRTIFGSGELAFTEEASALVPGIETVSVKRGLREGRGDGCTREQYRERNPGAVHTHPVRARELIRAGALKAMQRAQSEPFGLIPLRPPFRMVTVLRATAENPQRTYTVQEHATSLIAAMNERGAPKPVESDEQLNDLLCEPFEPGL
ncbi:MAG: M55 family metallopeptidase [Kiritimatiellae bacterium]|nr:M55 family metallopeptidase [Kiritimatiellia bacterium]